TVVDSRRAAAPALRSRPPRRSSDLGALSLIQRDEQGDTSKLALDEEELIARVAAFRANNSDLVVFVAGDGAVRYDAVLRVLQRLRTEARVDKATLLTKSPEPPAR